MEEMKKEKVSRPKIVEEVSEEVITKIMKMNEVIEVVRKDLKEYMEEFKEIK